MLLFKGILVLAMAAASAQSAIVISEGFDDVSALPGKGWALLNASSPLGTTDWFQGNSSIFPSHSGAPDSYIAANFLNAAAGGDIGNWLISPVRRLVNGDQISFWTRTQFNPTIAPDRLQLRFSSSGPSTNFADFNIVLSVNENLTATDYPAAWTHFTYNVTGLAGIASGRFAFNYSVPDTSVNGDYIGVDDVVLVSAIPEPSTALSAGVFLLILLSAQRLRWRRRTAATILGGAMAAFLSAQAAEPEKKAKWESVKVEVVQKYNSRQPGTAALSVGRTYEVEGTQSSIAARSVAPRRSRDAVATKLPNGGTAARLGPSYMSNLHATRNADGSVTIGHQRPGKKAGRRSSTKENRHAR